MKINKYKVMDNVLVFLLVLFPVMAVLAYPIAYWPHYEKKVYEQQEALTQEQMDEIAKERESLYGMSLVSDFTGYPISGIKTELVSYEQFQEKKFEAFCLEVNAEDLEPTGFYERVYEFSTGVSMSGGIRRNVESATKYPQQYVSSFFETILKRSKAIYAQYYALTLEDGNKVLVLLSDTVLDIPKKGKIRLPYAAWHSISLDEEEGNVRKLVREYHLQYDDYLESVDVLDASTRWFLFNDDIEKAYEERRVLWGILCIGGIIGALAVYFGSVILLKRAK